MKFDELTKKDINVLASYKGIVIHGDCRHLWKIYTTHNGRLY